MKKFLILFFIILFTNYNFAAAQEFNCPDIKETISVTGTNTELADPDTAIITLSIETNAKTANEAVAENSKKTNAVLTKLKRMLSPSDKIKTSSYSVQPVYSYNSSKNVLTGYKVVNQIKITTSQVKNTGTFIDAAVENGANTVSNINFTVENKNLYNTVLSKAAKDAKEQAAVVACALGVRLIGVKQASVSYDNNRYPAMYFKREASALGTASTPVEPGEVEIKANVNVDLYISK